MDAKQKRVQQARIIRIARKLHRVTGIFLFVFFFIIAVTGLLLGWKKNSGGYLLTDTQQGVSADLQTWLPVDSLQKLASTYLHQQVDANLSTELDRFDARPGKGIVKFVYKDHYWGLQLDATTGQLLSVERRRSDFIEHLHDASFIDNELDVPYGLVKLVYTSIMGLALILFTITGFWLWYGPKRMRHHKHS